jgi:hypothetical protein
MGSSPAEFDSAKKIGEVLMHIRRWILMAVIWACAASAHAETRVLNKPVTCDATSTVLNTLVTEFGETPQWQGSNEAQGTRFVLTVNLKTGAWSLIEFTAVTACVIGVGENASSAWGVPVVYK